MTKPEDLAPVPLETIVVASKVKQYIKDRTSLTSWASFRTSDACMDDLSEFVRKLLDRAICKAANDGRKTVLDRDIRDAVSAWLLEQP